MSDAMSATGRPEPDALAVALAAGHDAMATVARGLAQATPQFDANVRDALALLLACSGRVVVSGLGKSGLVGAKLAATLASTGTPAFFVHAADALHGDAGMVARDDVLLAISKSGETAEVVQFAAMVQRRGSRVVSMTACGGGSSLHQLADAPVDVPCDREADPWDLVPTTSTALTAILGDAIAVALMVARGFGPDDFHEHHPGGALGARLSAPALAGGGSVPPIEQERS
jgi:arabinose-5-phosphate isomerase